MRQSLGDKGLGDDPDFRWRGGEVSRIEGFSDAVFGFAMTLLIVSLEVPKSFEALKATLMQFPAFSISFLFLFFLWYQHYLFFRRYGLNDLSLIFINGVLMFLVLFFVFPFRWLVTFLINFLLLNNAFGMNIPTGLEGEFALSDYPILHTVYALGMAAIFACYMWFYHYAGKQREALELDNAEMALTVSSKWSNFVVVAVALISIVLVWVLPEPFNAPISGWAFAAIWPMSYWLERRIKRHYANNPR